MPERRFREPLGQCKLMERLFPFLVPAGIVKV